MLLAFSEKRTRQSNPGLSLAPGCASGAKHGKGGGDENDAVVPKFFETKIQSLPAKMIV